MDVLRFVQDLYIEGTAGEWSPVSGSSRRYCSSSSMSCTPTAVLFIPHSSDKFSSLLILLLHYPAGRAAPASLMAQADEQQCNLLSALGRYSGRPRCWGIEWTFRKGNNKKWSIVETKGSEKDLARAMEGGHKKKKVELQPWRNSRAAARGLTSDSKYLKVDMSFGSFNSTRSLLRLSHQISNSRTFHLCTHSG